MWRSLVRCVDYLCEEHPNEIMGTLAWAVLLGLWNDSWLIGILALFAIPALLVVLYTAFAILAAVLKVVIAVTAWLFVLMVRLVAAIVREAG
jgi:hypothetical protein